MTFRYRNANFRNSCSASALSAAIGYLTKSKKEKRQRNRREYETRAVHFEALEPRLLLSADFMPVHGSIDVPGETDQFTFNISEDTRIYFDALTSDGHLAWSLTGPHGTEVPGIAITNSDGQSGAATSALDLVAGDYTLSVTGAADATGSYSFRLLDVATATPITSGTPVSGTLPSGTETALYRFDAQTGEKFFFDQQSNSGGAAYWRLIDPFDRTVWSNWFQNGDVDVQALAFSGSYTLAIEGDVSNASPVDFSFAVQKVEDTTAALTVGATVDGAIAHTGQQNRYTFDLASAKRLYFDSLTNDPNLSWRLIGPRGEVNSTPFSFSNSDGPSGTPLLDLVAGSYTLIVDGYLDTTDPYSFRLLDLSAATPITLGDPVSGTLPSGNETALYRFEATAGDQVLLSRQALSAGSPYWRLIDPYGGQVYANYFNDSPTLTLPLTGTYTLLFEGQIGENGTLQYTFNVTSEGHVDLPAPTGTPLVLGATTTGAIDTVGEEDNYVFDVTQPTQLLFDALTNSSDLTWSLIGPQGEVATRFFTGSDGGNIGGDPTLTLKVPGTYQLRVQGSGSSVGSYSFRLLDVATAVPITSGTPVSGTLPSGTETALYRFDSQAGEKFFFDQQSNTGVTVSWRLIDPFGRTVWSNWFQNGDIDVQTLAFSGSYTLAIEGYVSNASPVDFSFAVQKVEDTTAALTVGTMVDGVIAHAGQQARYTFDLAGAARLCFDSLTNDPYLSWRLIGPRGEVNSTPVGFSYSDGVSGTPLLDLVAGSYTLIVDGYLDATGPYSFRLLDVATATPITLGDPVSGTLPSGNDTALYRFDAQAGDQVLLNRQALSAGSPYWRLIDPYGGQVYANSFADSSTLTLPLTGTYTLLFEGQIDANGALQYTFNVTSEGHVDLPAPTGTPLVLGATTTGTIDTAGEEDNYVFDITQPTQLLFDALNNSGLTWSLIGPQGEIASRFFTNSDAANFGSDPVITLKIPGTYQLRVQGSGSTGSYSFRLLDIAMATPIASATPVSGTLPTGTETALY
ncbi:LEPR-XLL domain-containing protein, partial [Mesorhizobium sp. M7A.F.Ca.CA.001.09.2.1]